MFAAYVHAGPITWEKRVQELHIESGEPSLAVVFRFKNESAAPVTFGRIAPSCGCTVGELPRATWQPGESGELTARFNAGDVTGRKSVTIHVAYESPTSENDTLSFSVDVSPWAEVQPRLLWWRRGEPPAAKQVSIEFGDNFSDARVEIVPGPASQMFALSQHGGGRGHTIIDVTPTTTDAVTTNQLKLRLVRRDGDSVERVIFLRVMERAPSE